MTPELENKIIEALGKLEPLVAQFHFGITSPTSVKRWFTPKELLLKSIAVSAQIAPSAEIKLALSAIHGSIDILGFRETVRLAMILFRRKHAGTERAKKT